MSGSVVLIGLAAMFVVSYVWQRSIQRKSELNAKLRRSDATAGTGSSDAAMAFTTTDFAWTPGHHFGDSVSHHSGGHCGSGDFGGGDCGGSGSH